MKFNKFYSVQTDDTPDISNVKVQFIFSFAKANIINTA